MTALKGETPPATETRGQFSGSLEDRVREVAAASTVEALERHLPELLSRLTLPRDPNHRHTLQEAADRLKIPLYTLRERIREGEVLAIRDGKRVFVLEGDLIAYNAKLRYHEEQRREHEARLTSDVSPRIAGLLQDKPKAQKVRAA